MSYTPRDTIQISLGSSANAITAHSLNLQGLACTSGDEGYSAAVCDPQTTHSLERNHWVPRVLLIDEPTKFFVSSQVSSLQQQQPQVSSSSPFAIQPLDPSLTLQHDEPQAWNQFFESASVLAYSSHSRYYQEPAETTTSSYRADAANPRHVVWDDKEPEEEEEDPEERRDRFQQEKTTWKRNTEAPLQEQLSTMAESMLATSPPSSWNEFLMPPFRERSKVALPFSNQSQMVTHWDSYNNTNHEWKEGVLFEEVRRLLEDSDACQGVTITTQGHGIYAGLTTALLQEFQEECKSAGRMVFYVTNPGEDEKESPQEEEQEEDPWQASHVDRLRRNVASGLAWNDFTENAHVVLPLRLDTQLPQFESTAQLAMALEACTLPFRLQARKDPRYKMGLQNAPFFGQGGSDDRWGTTAQRLTMGEFLSILHPAPRYSVLELDIMTAQDQKITNQELWNRFQLGTSVERDQRMRQGGRDHPTIVLPGGWLKDVSRGGILTSRSLPTATTTENAATDRSLHHHFSLSTSIRPVLQDDLDKYLTSLVQGMGIQYRAERSMCTVVSQTVGQLTRIGGYGAGAYWKKLIAKDTPVVAVLGNTSRPYSHLRTMATDMKAVLGARYRGYHQRDVSLGVLPEVEDCQEALANCWDLVDVYQPPDGSGLVDEGDIDF